jgi:hypothetical protein
MRRAAVRENMTSRENRSRVGRSSTAKAEGRTQPNASPAKWTKAKSELNEGRRKGPMHGSFLFVDSKRSIRVAPALLGMRLLSSVKISGSSVSVTIVSLELPRARDSSCSETKEAPHELPRPRAGNRLTPRAHGRRTNTRPESRLSLARCQRSPAPPPTCVATRGSASRSLLSGRP